MSTLLRKLQDICGALAFCQVTEYRDKAERIWKELRIKKTKMSTPSPTKSMVSWFFET